MDWLGGLLGAAGSVFGSLMNTSSQQAINAANIQQQQWSASGGYLPGLVANAERAGLSPLAVLGQHGPNMAVEVSGQPGAGLQGAGAALSRIDPYAQEKEEMAQKLGQSQVDRARQEASNAKQQGVMNALMIDRISSHGGYIPPGWSEPTPTGVLTEGVHEAMGAAGPAIASGLGRIGDWWSGLSSGSNPRWSQDPLAGQYP